MYFVYSQTELHLVSPSFNKSNTDTLYVSAGGTRLHGFYNVGRVWYNEFSDQLRYKRIIGKDMYLFKFSTDITPLKELPIDDDKLATTKNVIHKYSDNNNKNWSVIFYIPADPCFKK